jgi:hypothetical protein
MADEDDIHYENWSGGISVCLLRKMSWHTLFTTVFSVGLYRKMWDNLYS